MTRWGMRGVQVRAVAVVVLIAVAAFSASAGRADTPARASSFPITIQVSRRSLVLYAGALTVTGHVGDTGQPSISVRIEASSGGGPWQDVGGGDFLASSGNVAAQPVIDRNTLFRVHVTSSNSSSGLNAYSRTVPVYVVPEISLSLTRTSTSILEVGYQGRVHPVRHAPRRRLFIYTRHPGTRLFHLVASRWLRFSAQTIPQYTLLYRLHDSRAVTVLVCTQVPLLPDMGKPFRDPGCGRPNGVP